MSGSTPTITAQKSAFLTRQIRALSAPLSIPPSTHTTLPSLTDKSLAELLSKANDKVRSHNRSVFSAQTTRHIAEQIETLYWNEVRSAREQTLDSPIDAGETTVTRDADLSTSAGLASLGADWADILPPSAAEQQDEGGAEDEAQAQRYSDLFGQLTALARQRDEAQAALQRYRRLRELLQPYEEPQTRIQPNLVTKDGELGRELERMRALLARVTARMGEQKELQGQGVAASEVTGDGMMAVFEERLRIVLDGDKNG